MPGEKNRPLPDAEKHPRQLPNSAEEPTAVNLVVPVSDTELLAEAHAEAPTQIPSAKPSEWDEDTEPTRMREDRTEIRSLSEDRIHEHLLSCLEKLNLTGSESVSDQFKENFYGSMAWYILDQIKKVYPEQLKQLKRLHEIIVTVPSLSTEESAAELSSQDLVVRIRGQEITIPSRIITGILIDLIRQSPQD